MKNLKLWQQAYPGERTFAHEYKLLRAQLSWWTSARLPRAMRRLVDGPTHGVCTTFPSAEINRTHETHRQAATLRPFLSRNLRGLNA